MSKLPMLALIGAALSLVLSPLPAAAQSQEPAAGNAAAQAQDADSTPMRGTASAASGRIRESRRSRPAAAPTPEENMVAAQAVATAASVGCQVTQANFLGQTAEGAKSYEAACATGPGYILIGAEPAQAVDCVLLAGQATIDRARDPAADLGTQCVIPQNMDVLRVVSAYATEAGVPCAVDEGASIGKASSGNLIYEVGCTGVDGFWIEKTATGWNKTECAIVTTQNATCRYSTAAEGAASLKRRLTGSEAASCDVTEGRYMGANANGAFYEARCAGAEGYIFHVKDEVTDRVYACAIAAPIGGGCTLTRPTAPGATSGPPSPR